ncbi:MAG: hypothetical protein J5563_06100 [Clostridia bacterium]|nr:hypothetical protein [Clostridia bacterium]
MQPKQTERCATSKNEKRGNSRAASRGPDTGRCFTGIMYTSLEGREQYDCEITEDIHARPGTERTVRDDEAAKTMNEAGRKLRNKKKKN